MFEACSEWLPIVSPLPSAPTYNSGFTTCIPVLAPPHRDTHRQSTSKNRLVEFSIIIQCGYYVNIPHFLLWLQITDLDRLANNPWQQLEANKIIWIQEYLKINILTSLSSQSPGQKESKYAGHLPQQELNKTRYMTFITLYKWVSHNYFLLKTILMKGTNAFLDVSYKVFAWEKNVSIKFVGMSKL
jgi:hypothetical protein